MQRLELLPPPGTIEQVAIDTNQVLTLTVANLPTFTLVLLGIIYNNACLNDLRDLLRAEFKNESQSVRAESKSDRQGLRSELKGEMRELHHVIEKSSSASLRITTNASADSNAITNPAARSC